MIILKDDLESIRIQSVIAIQLLYVEEPTIKDVLAIVPPIAQYLMSKYNVPVYGYATQVESDAFIVCASASTEYRSICELIVFCYEKIMVSSMSDISLLCISELRFRWKEVEELLWIEGVLGG